MEDNKNFNIIFKGEVTYIIENNVADLIGCYCECYLYTLFVDNVYPLFITCMIHNYKYDTSVNFTKSRL